MGTYIDLYQHPKAAALVAGLNDLHKSWGRIPHEQWISKRRKLNIPDGKNFPDDAKACNVDGFSYKISALDEYLKDQNTLPVYEMFGFPSPDPEEPYRIPDWTKSLRHIDNGIAVLRASSAQNPANGIKALEAMKKMAQWVLAQKNKTDFFLWLG